MTLGYVQRELRLLSERVEGLEHNADRAFRRLMVWSAISAFIGGASVVLVYLLRG